MALPDRNTRQISEQTIPSTSGLCRMDTPMPKRAIRIFALPGQINTRDRGGRIDRGIVKPIEPRIFDSIEE